MIAKRNKAIQGDFPIPQALEAEKSILSLLLKDPVQFMEKALEAKIHRDCFYFTGHKILWDLLEDRHRKNQPMDIILINQALTDAGNLDSLGGQGGMAELYTYDSMGAYFGHHLELLKQKHVQREIIKVCQKSVKMIYEGEDDSRTMIDGLEKEVKSLRSLTESQALLDTRRQLQKGVDNIEWRMMNPGQIQGISTGFPRLDMALNGLMEQAYIILAARPSVGKTALLLNILKHIAVVNEIPVGLFSMEMPAHQLFERMICGEAGYNITRSQRGQRPTRQEVESVSNAVRRLARNRFLIDDRDGMTMADIRSSARRMVEEKGARVIGIDYIGLIRGSGSKRDNWLEIQDISREIKMMARELNVPVIALSQLNRESAKQGEKSDAIPGLHNLRGSGALEQDADQVLVLHRQPPTKEEPVPKNAVVSIKKNRNGITGVIEYEWIPSLTQFKEKPLYTEPTVH